VWGKHVPSLLGAHGKAIEAFLPEDELNELLKKDKALFSWGPRKILTEKG
jgi:DNA-binding IclR family transcriptional regulator